MHDFSSYVSGDFLSSVSGDFLSYVPGDFLSYVSGYNTPSMVHLAFLLGSLLLLYYFSVAGRPVGRDSRLKKTRRKERKLYEAAAAERAEILERLDAGSPVSKDVSDQSGSRVNGSITDGDKSLLKPLIADSSDPVNVATVTVSLSSSAHVGSVYKSAKKVAKPTASGDVVVDEIAAWAKIVQTKVDLHDDSLKQLKDLAKETAKSDKGCILQVDSWGVLMQSGAETELLRIPNGSVPAIFHAEYATGLLTITGLRLEDAVITAANRNHAVKLDVVRFQKPSRRWGFSHGVEVSTLALTLHSKDIDGAVVYATKSVVVNEQSVDVTSPFVHIQDARWRTVLQLWVPTIGLWLLVCYHIRFLGELVHGWFPMLWTYNPAKLQLVTIVVFGIALTSTRFRKFVEYHAETMIGGFGRGLWVVYNGFLNLKGPRLTVSQNFGFGGYLPPPPPPPPQENAKGPTKVVQRKRHSHGEDVFNDDEDSATNSVDDPQWKWPAYDQFQDEYGRIETKKRVEEPESADATSPFRVIYSRKANQHWSDVVQISLSSLPLIRIVQKYLPHIGDLQCLDKPTIQGKDLFVVLDALRNHHELNRSGGNDIIEESDPSSNSDARKGELHLKHLLRFMDKEYNDVSARFLRMSGQERVAHDMLWAFLSPGKKVVYNCDHSEELLAATVSRSTNILTSHGWALRVELLMYNYNGRSYNKCMIARAISKFEGERPFTTVAVRPIEFEGEPTILNRRFLANGKIFHDLAMKNSHRFMQYSGPLFQQRLNGSCWQLFKENSDGRVMIDLTSFAKMNPGYPMDTAQPPTDSSRNTDPLTRMKFYASSRGNFPSISVTVSGPITLGETDVSDESLICAPAIVYGFSFTLKQWGCFSIHGFSEISFDTNAFSMLVMEPEVKGLVYNLVSQYITTPLAGSSGAGTVKRVDPIKNKGEGCIFLCYGPPGTGKTLTAESVAENMRRPLWSLSVSELGTTPDQLEKTLFKILDVAATWRAVLLLDEADVYLEKRTMRADLTRNAMTGIFLRLLEYYRGVLFLTTNRIGTFDDAFRSRISMFLRYPKLEAEQKEQIWKTLLGRVGLEDVEGEFLSELASQNLNGREIRNVIHTAQTWAKSGDNSALQVEHVKYVMEILTKSLDLLTDAIQNQDDI